MGFTVDAGSKPSKNFSKRKVTGTFSGGAPTGETITVGQLSNIEYANVTGATVLAVSGNVITVTSTATAGFWEAVGI